MQSSTEIPSLADLALQYGTINQDQFKHVRKLYQFRIKEGHRSDFEKILLTLNLANPYQIGLLKLIREYLIIKKQGEAFGRIAIEKGFANPEDIEKALEIQRKEFKRARLRKLIGDILVENRVITEKQKNDIIREQTFLDSETDKIISLEQDLSEPVADEANKNERDGLSLTEFEKQFLKIKSLDMEFEAGVIEKKLATKEQISLARKEQEQSFATEKKLKGLGDVMVGLGFITQNQKNQIMDELRRQEAFCPTTSPAGIEVHISEDRMEAVVILDPDIKGIGVQDIRSALEARGIRFGIYPDAILQGHLDMKNHEFIGARQDFTVELIKNRKAAYYFSTDKVDGEEKKKGETLAEQYLGRETILKKDLFGNDIQKSNGYDLTFRCGAGARFSKDHTKAFAGRGGFPSLSIERKIFVHPPIHILEDADLKHGPIEDYANITVSGTLTGAYPVTAGTLTAREIRGARVQAIGSVTSRIGMTDSLISTQGDVHALYLHNCRIEAFGNVYVEKEIVDCVILCSGKIDSGGCRTLGSTLYAKKGMELGSVGSTRTRPCVIGAGTEHHLLEKVRQINDQIKAVSAALDDFKERKQRQDALSERTFKKMVGLKIFHDRAKAKKTKLIHAFKEKKESRTHQELKNIANLVYTFDKRMEDAITAIKTLNETKKKADGESERLVKIIQQVEAGIRKQIMDLKMNLTAVFEWARKQERHAWIRINGMAQPETSICGVYASLVLTDEMKRFSAIERQQPDGRYQWEAVTGEETRETDPKG